MSTTLIRDNGVAIRRGRELGMALYKGINEVVLGQCLGEMAIGGGMDSVIGIKHNDDVMVKVIP